MKNIAHTAFIAAGLVLCSDILAALFMPRRFKSSIQSLMRQVNKLENQIFDLQAHLCELERDNLELNRTTQILEDKIKEKS